MGARKKKVETLAKDVVVEICDDPAFFGLLDIETYDKDLPSWDFATLSERVVDEMNRGHIVAWGNPEVNVNVRFTTKQPGVKASRDIVDSTSATLTTSGLLCFAGYTSITMCAQFGTSEFPQPADRVFRVKPGTHRVDVHRFFAHRAGEQFPDDDLAEDVDHYVVVLTYGKKSTRRHSFIPWALPI